MECRDIVAEYLSDSKKNFKNLMDALYQAEHLPDTGKNIQQLINFHESIIKNLKNTVNYRLKGRDSS